MKNNFKIIPIIIYCFLFSTTIYASSDRLVQALLEIKSNLEAKNLSLRSTEEMLKIKTEMETDKLKYLSLTRLQRLTNIDFIHILKLVMTQTNENGELITSLFLKSSMISHLIDRFDLCKKGYTRQNKALNKSGMSTLLIHNQNFFDSHKITLPAHYAFENGDCEGSLHICEKDNIISFLEKFKDHRQQQVYIIILDMIDSNIYHVELLYIDCFNQLAYLFDSTPDEQDLESDLKRYSEILGSDFYLYSSQAKIQNDNYNCQFFVLFALKNIITYKQYFTSWLTFLKEKYEEKKIYILVVIPLEFLRVSQSMSLIKKYDQCLSLIKNDKAHEIPRIIGEKAAAEFIDWATCFKLEENRQHLTRFQGTEFALEAAGQIALEYSFTKQSIRTNNSIESERIKFLICLAGES